MIRRIRYLVECDNDCGSKPVGVLSKSDIKNHFLVYRYRSINPLADELTGDVYKELQFCCKQCADEYFAYYGELKGKYILLNAN